MRNQTGYNKQDDILIL